MKHLQTTAIILRRIHYGEADRILTVITPDHGKVSLLAKGVRKSKSRLAGGLELFSVSEISFIDGRSELKTVISTRLLRHYGRIVENIDRTMLGYALLKLIDTHTQDSCDKDFYELLDNGLQALHEHSDHPDVVYAWFVNKLLHLSGAGLKLDEQVGGAAFLEEALYAFDYDAMGFIAQASGKFGPNHIKFLRLLSKVTTPANLLQVANARVLATELRPLLEQCINLTK